MTRKQTALAVAVIAAAAGLGWWRFAPAPAPLAWQGYVDADYVKVGPTQQGLLTSLSVKRGDHVVEGAPLFVQDDGYDRAARDEAAAKLAQAEDQLRNLQSASRETEIAQAKADLAQMLAARDRANKDLERAQALVKTAAGTRQRLDQAQADAQSAAAQVQAAAAKLAQMESPTGRVEEIAAQQATVNEMKAQLAEAAWRLAQRHVTAPVSALVADVYAWPGETLAAGAPVVSLLPPGNVLVRFFVPERQLAKIHAGETMAILCDSCSPGLTAKVSFVSPQPEYTPPVIFSQQTRDKLVYLIEARPVGDQTTVLKPGQPVTVQPVSSGPTDSHSPPPPNPLPQGEGGRVDR